jgi:ligand-binding sensor domain-containing protein/signal transduction histidine kinase
LKSSNISLDQWTRQCRALLATFALPGLAACFAAFACTTYAIDPNRAMSQYIHERWGTEQGFPRGPVYAIAQSSDGYLWIGTQAGLVRFDGLNFHLVRDAPALRNNASVLGLTPDRDGNLWVRLEGSTLLRYRDGVFDSPTSDLASMNSLITAMGQANQGELLLSFMERGVIIHRQGRFEMVADASALPRSPVLSVAQTSDGSVWVGTRGTGLFRLRQGQTSSVTEGLPDPKVNCLLADVNGILWVGTDDGIVRWIGSRLTRDGIPASFKHVQVLVLVKDRDANIWVGTDSGGLLRLNDRGFPPLNEGEGRSREAVTAVFEDREGNLWIGSDSGIERLRDSAFVTYSLPEGLPSDGNKPVFVDSENRLWVPPVAGGLWWMKDGRHGRVTIADLDQDVVYSIAGRNSELWLGRQRGGLTALRSERGSFITRSYTQADGLAQDSIYSVYLARDGTVWAGTLSAGVSALRNHIFTNYTTANGLASNTVASILEGHDGTMWFATPSGLSALSNGHWQSYATRNGLPSENVNCLLEDSTGVLWVGTASGLSFLGPGGFRVPGEAPTSLRAQILGLAEDRYGWLWIATSNHVLRVNRDKLLRDALAEGDVREYGLADGLRGLEGVKRHDSVVTDPQGRIWFSLNRGISVVDPARLTGSSARAIAHVEAISADGSPINIGDSIRVPASRKRITFSYVGLSLAVPERVRFRYFLDGFDRNWSEPTAAREAVYTNLGPGSYRFRLIASNSDGFWNSSETTVPFRVDPVFWQTWWFRISTVFVIGLAILMFLRLRVLRLTKQMNMRFEERFAERTRIAQELHDTLLQGFLSASMQLNVANDRLAVDSPAKPLVGRVLELMSHVIEEGRNSVRGLRSSKLRSSDLEQAFSQVRKEFPVQSQIEFRVIVEGVPRPLRPLIRDEVYHIGHEALSNAFRHSHASDIEVELEYAPSHLRVLVRDNGGGIDNQVLRSGRDGHWGLSGMKERTERIGGRLRVLSSAIAGTEVELSIPGTIAFNFPASDRRWRWLSKLRLGKAREEKPEAESEKQK